MSKRMTDRIILSPMVSEMMSRVPEDRKDEAARNLYIAALQACTRAMMFSGPSGGVYKGKFLAGNAGDDGVCTTGAVFCTATQNMRTRTMTIKLTKERWRA